MAGPRRQTTGGPHQPELPGLAVDYQGNPVIDPTKNVLDLVAAAIKRQDDLREAESRHVREIAGLRAEYTAELRRAETARIDAIRAVDVGAVNRAAEVSAQQATTLAAQVAASAETLRTQVQAAATASNIALANALDPIQKAIDDLRRAQYEAQGIKSHGGETRLNAGSVMAGLAVLISLVVAVATLLR
jgi:hypothetical protein